MPFDKMVIKNWHIIHPVNNNTFIKYSQITKEKMVISVEMNLNGYIIAMNNFKGHLQYTEVI